MSVNHVEWFHPHLATGRHISASTQNQALTDLICLFRGVVKNGIDEFGAVRAKRPIGVPTVLSQDEARRVLAATEPDSMLGLITRLLRVRTPVDRVLHSARHGCRPGARADRCSIREWEQRSCHDAASEITPPATRIRSSQAAPGTRAPSPWRLGRSRACRSTWCRTSRGSAGTPALASLG